MSRVLPDIALPYDDSRIYDENIAVIAVRPETNKVTYESAILKGVSPYADLIYMANFSGTVVRTSKIIESQYASQLKFAQRGRDEVYHYPEMIPVIERKFNVAFDKMPLYGSYEYCRQVSGACEWSSAQKLFNTIVPREEFLELHGQTIKKIDDVYIINYDIPAILTKHNKNTDIFVIAIRCKDTRTELSNINHDIYTQLLHKQGLSLIDADQRQQMEWFNKVRRTYHISNSPAKAMFDMMDYILDDDGSNILFEQTPLGAALLNRNIATREELTLLKSSPIVYLKEKEGGHRLINIVNACRIKTDIGLYQRSIDECCRIFDSIDWVRSFQNKFLSGTRGESRTLTP